MVQAEVADRLAAGARQPDLRRAQRQGRLVRRGPARGHGRPQRVLAGAQRRLRPGRARPAASRRTTPAAREEVFACVDAAFAQRRKTLRAALAGWAGGAGRGRGGAACGRHRPPHPRRAAGQSHEFAAARRRCHGDAPRLGWRHDVRRRIRSLGDRARPGQGQPRAVGRGRAATTATTTCPPSSTPSSVYDEVTVDAGRPAVGRHGRPARTPTWCRSTGQPGRAGRAHRWPDAAGVDEPVHIAHPQGDPGRGRHGRRLGRRRGGAGGLRRRCGTGLAADDLHDLAAELGADVPFALHRRHRDRHRARRRSSLRCWPAASYHWVLRPQRRRPVHARGLRRVRPAARVVPGARPAASATDDDGAAQRRRRRARPGAAQRPAGRRAARCARAWPTSSTVGMEYGALGGVVSGSGPTVAFLVSDNEHALDLAVALTASGVASSVKRATGPVAAPMCSPPAPPSAPRQGRHAGEPTATPAPPVAGGRPAGRARVGRAPGGPARVGRADRPDRASRSAPPDATTDRQQTAPPHRPWSS